MKEQLLRFFGEHPQLAPLLSLLLSVIIAIAGLVPSFFITAANIVFFGFWPGLFLSFLGEALGAMLSFVVYRKGFKKGAVQKSDRFPKVRALMNATGREAFLLILSLRLIPFVPSGIITFAAAVGRVSFLTFASASSLGKVPVLLLEGYSVYEVSRFGWIGKIILLAAGIGLIIYLAGRLRQRR